MKQNRLWAWIVVGLSMVYFFVPLIATFIFSLRMRRGELSFDAYASVFADPRFLASFAYSLAIGAFTIVLGILVVVPAVYYVRLRMPWLRPIMEFITLLPLVIPALVLVYGYIRLYNSSSLIPFTGSALGTDILLVCACMTLALPYMYRAVDTGMRTIDIRTLTEAAQILGASQWSIISRIVFPNILVAVLSGAFLTLAIVIGEFTIASLLNRPAFGPYLVTVGTNRAYEPSALAIISLLVTWGAMGMIQLLARFAPKTAQKD
ncbi:ABC transporter permease [Shinella sp. BYT-45]|uniref:ABC transporter permease n=1 Tax=Shinella sp. BYT-45 TaxID=3377377 RepID=UPI0039815AC3